MHFDLKLIIRVQSTEPLNALTKLADPLARLPLCGHCHEQCFVTEEFNCVRCGLYLHPQCAVPALLPGRFQCPLHAKDPARSPNATAIAPPGGLTSPSHIAPTAKRMVDCDLNLEILDICSMQGCAIFAEDGPIGDMYATFCEDHALVVHADLPSYSAWQSKQASIKLCFHTS